MKFERENSDQHKRNKIYTAPKKMCRKRWGQALSRK